MLIINLHPLFICYIVIWLILHLLKNAPVNAQPIIQPSLIQPFYVIVLREALIGQWTVVS